MKTQKLFFIFLLSLLLVGGNDLYAQKSVQLSDIELVNLGDGQLFAQERGTEKKPIEGKVRIITGFTTEYIDAEFVNGIAVGKWEYYKNNNLSEVTNYENGYENGEKLSYYGDGKTLSMKVNLLKGKVDGIATRYDSNGNKEYEKSMKNGVDDGAERTYGKDGEILSETIFKDGKAEGKSFATMNNGSSDCYKQTRFYKNGQLDGEYSEVFCTGEAKIKGKYIAGEKDGLWEYFKKDGKRAKPTEEYSKGDLVKKISYFSNGNVEREQSYKGGKEDGIVKQYTQDGKLKSEKNYVLGKQVGRQMQYYTSTNSDYIEISNYSAEGKKHGEFTETFADNNVVKTKGQYVNGEKDGKWITSNKDGSVIKETDYNKGKVVGSKKTEKNEGAYKVPAYTAVTYYDADDYLTGEYVETFNATKKIKQKGQYIKSRKEGKWLYYDETGKLTREENYKDGVEDAMRF